MLSKKELTIIGGILGFLIIWFGFLLDSFNSWAVGNATLAYAVFILLYSFLVMNYIFDIKVTDNIKMFMALTIVFLSFDIIFFPLLISKDAPLILTPETVMSSDVFIYNLLPTTLPHIYRYYLTYVGAPFILLILAALLLRTSSFKNILRHGL